MNFKLLKQTLPLGRKNGTMSYIQWKPENSGIVRHTTFGIKYTVQENQTQQ